MSLFIVYCHLNLLLSAGSLTDLINAITLLSWTSDRLKQYSQQAIDLQARLFLPGSTSLNARWCSEPFNKAIHVQIVMTDIAPSDLVRASENLATNRTVIVHTRRPISSVLWSRE